MMVVLTETGPRLSENPPRRPSGEHLVRVHIELAGVCRSDLKEITGKRPGVSQFGHEIVGVVERSTLAELPIGQRVTLDPNVRVERSTGFASTMWVAGTADGVRAALPTVPSEVESRRLIFTEPLACARHCLTTTTRHLNHDWDGSRLAVLGAGTAGVLIAGLARAYGIDVVVGNRSQDRNSFLRERSIVDSSIRVVTELPSEGADVVVVATSYVVPEILREALRVVTPDGLVLLYGGTAPGDKLPELDCDQDTVRRTETMITTKWQGKLVRIGGSYGTNQDDFGAAVRALAEFDPSVLPVERLITNEVSLGDLPETLRGQLNERPLGKTLVLPPR